MCEMAIEFEPTDNVMPRVLERIEDHGFVLRGLKLIPANPTGRSMMQIDLGGWNEWDDLRALEQGLSSLDPSIRVIQLATGATATA